MSQKVNELKDILKELWSEIDHEFEILKNELEQAQTNTVAQTIMMRAEQTLNPPIKRQEVNTGETEVSPEELAHLDNYFGKKIAETIQKAHEVKQLAISYQEAQPKDVGRIQSRLREVMTTAVKTIGYALMTTSLALTINYERTRYKVASQHNADGSITYKHPDAETTLALDYMAGKTDLTPNQKLALIKLNIRKSLRIHNVPIPEDMDAFTEEQFKDFFNTLLKKKETLYIANSIAPFSTDRLIKEGLPDNWLDTFFKKPMYNPKLYETLWRLEQSCDNPRIRWEDTGTSLAGRAHYSSTDNTLHIASPWMQYMDFEDEYISELSHAKQFADTPISSTFKYISSVFRTMKASALHGENPNTAYDAEYGLRDSLEYEAHHDIEHRLEEEIDKAETDKN